MYDLGMCKWHGHIKAFIQTLNKHTAEQTELFCLLHDSDAVSVGVLVMLLCCYVVLHCLTVT